MRAATFVHWTPIEVAKWVSHLLKKAEVGAGGSGRRPSKTNCVVIVAAFLNRRHILARLTLVHLRIHARSSLGLHSQAASPFLPPAFQNEGVLYSALRIRYVVFFILKGKN